MPDAAFLILFTLLLIRVEASAVGRASAYGGVYIAASVVWFWLVEQRTPDRWDLIGPGVCLTAAAIILFGPRAG